MSLTRLNTAIDNREIVRIGARAGRLVGTVGIALGYNASYHTVKVGFVDENGEYTGESTRIGADHIEYIEYIETKGHSMKIEITPEVITALHNLRAGVHVAEAVNVLDNADAFRAIDEAPDPERAGGCTADAAPAAQAPAAERTPAKVKPLAQDVTTPATMFDPELTYYADGTTVVMRWQGGEKTGTAAGMTTDRGPYQYQVVQFQDGTTDNVAPHVLHRTETPAPEPERYVAEYETVLDTPERLQRITITRHGHADPLLAQELPYDPQRNAARTLETLGWTITGMETYGGPSMFRARGLTFAGACAAGAASAVHPWVHLGRRRQRPQRVVL